MTFFVRNVCTTYGGLRTSFVPCWWICYVLDMAHEVQCLWVMANNTQSIYGVSKERREVTAEMLDAIAYRDANLADPEAWWKCAVALSNRAAELSASGDSPTVLFLTRKHADNCLSQALRLFAERRCDVRGK